MLVEGHLLPEPAPAGDLAGRRRFSRARPGGSSTRSRARSCSRRSRSRSPRRSAWRWPTWLSEYGRPVRLARAVESAVEIIAGTPSVVLAIFGLLVFSQSFLGFLSQNTAGGAVTGQSFLTAGAIMALLALPLIVGATREGLPRSPTACARPRTGWARPAPPRSATCCCPRSARTSPKASCSGWAG